MLEVAPDPLPSSSIRYSLVVATLQDEGEFAAFLRSLQTLEPGPSFEVIVVDQNPDDRVVRTLGTCSEGLTVVHERVPFRGASRARNLGAARARGVWLGFPDDDCRFSPDTLREVERWSSLPEAHVVTGCTVDPSGAPNLLPWAGQPSPLTSWNVFHRVTEPTLFVRRDTFGAVGGFDERFGPGAPFPAAEGIELMTRLLPSVGLAQGKAYYTPKVRVQHPTKIPPWTGWAVDRFHAYAKGAGGAVAKKPSLPMLLWGARIAAGATVRMLTTTGWRRKAYVARWLGFFRGVHAGIHAFGPRARQTATPEPPIS